MQKMICLSKLSKLCQHEQTLSTRNTCCIIFCSAHAPCTDTFYAYTKFFLVAQLISISKKNNSSLSDASRRCSPGHSDLSVPMHHQDASKKDELLKKITEREVLIAEV